MPATRILTRADVAELVDLPSCIEAVERAFLLHAEGRSLAPGVLGVPARAGGGFHLKTAGLDLQRRYFAAKCNANFADNPARRGLPAIQGVVVLCDADDGTLLALLDSIEITILRTGAATAVAARRLARQVPSVVTICGCGNQGRVQLRALAAVLEITRVLAFDLDRERAVRFAAEARTELGLAAEAAADLGAAARESDVCVTCTPSGRPLLRREDVRPGSFVAAVGADSHDKQELDPALVAASVLVVDVIEQCATIGELHHAIGAGLMTRGDVHAELAEILAGRKPGRTREDETIVFDSTGTALQDVAAAALAYERAVAQGRGVVLDLAATAAGP
jgi:alanine dehydrogenase